jgi:hypothetical protein
MQGTRSKTFQFCKYGAKKYLAALLKHYFFISCISLGCQSKGRKGSGWAEQFGGKDGEESTFLYRVPFLIQKRTLVGILGRETGMADRPFDREAKIYTIITTR